MRTLHLIMMTVLLAAVLAVGVGEAQHGHSADPQDHFTVVVERLDLTAAQRETLEEPFSEMMAAMQELHRLARRDRSRPDGRAKGRVREDVPRSHGGLAIEAWPGPSRPGSPLTNPVMPRERLTYAPGMEP